jgi:glutaconate CoA-transferase subunit B
VFVMLRQTPRTFVGRLDFRTSSGERVRVIVTDLGVLEPRGEHGELMLTQFHAGRDIDEVRRATGWPLRVADDVRETAPPTERELSVLRSLKTKGAA